MTRTNPPSYSLWDLLDERFGDPQARLVSDWAVNCIRGDPRHGGRGPAMERERAAQCDLFRCIFGNPWRPLFTPGFPPAVLGLARAVAEGDAALYPILADALDDHGAAGAAAHCHLPDHTRGCHVVDWVLRK